MSITLSTGMIIAGQRDDEWAVQNPPSGKYWRCWQCDNGTRTNDFTLIFKGYPVIANNWYIAGPFFTSEEATIYEFDGTNPCGDVTGKGTGDSTAGGGSGYTNEIGGVEGGGLRFILTNPPVGAIPPLYDYMVNGEQVSADVTYNYVDLPTSLGG